MRITIYGTSGAGGYFGAQLARIGEGRDVHRARRPLESNSIARSCVETPAGEIVIRPAKATGDPSQIGPVDMVLLGVKAWQVEEAVRNMRPVVGPATGIAVTRAAPSSSA
jgi:2-dehydropantoate 2-reductase